MKHTVTRRIATGALSAVMALSSLPTPAIAEAASKLSVQATEPQGSWRYDGKRWYFLLDAGGAVTGWQMIGGQWYLFNAAGTMLTDWQRAGGSDWYYLSPKTGAMVTGWLPWNGAWYWLAESGRMHQNQWLFWQGAWYWLGDSGAMATGWKQIGGKWYFFAGSGAMAQDTFTDDGYLVGPDGVWVESLPSDAEYNVADLSTADVMDLAASSATFTITSDEAHPFAQQLDAKHIQLVGDFEGGFQIADVSRVDACTIQVSIAGAFADAEALEGAGGLYFDRGSFADAKTLGLAVVGVEHEDASLLADQCSYDEQSGSFRLAVDAGTAQLPKDAGAALSADSSIAVQGVEVTGPHTAVVTVKVPGESAYDQLWTLSVALYYGGLTVSGTNVGSVTGWLSDEQSQSLLEYLLPSAYFYVERGADGKGWTLADDGSATVNLRLRMVADNGDFALGYADLGFVSEGVEAEDWSLVDDRTIEFVAASLTADELATLMDEYGMNDAARFLDAYAYALGAQAAEGVKLMGGMTDEWGVELPEDYQLMLNVFNNVGLGGGADEAADPTLEAQADVTPEQKARTALKEISGILGNAGTVVRNTRTIAGGKSKASELAATWFAPNHGLRPTELDVPTGYQGEAARQWLANAQSNWDTVQKKLTRIKQGLTAGSLIVGALGIVGSAIANTMTPTGVTLQDIMDKIFVAQSKVADISYQLGAISSEISAVRDKLDFATKATRLSDLCSKADSYSPWVSEAMEEFSKCSDRDTFDLSKDDPSTSETGKALSDLRKATQKQSAQNGGQLSAYNVALDLGKLIVGDSTLGMKGAVDSFFDYTASRVNWDPEAFHARRLFTCYVGYAFFNAYTAAMNELKWKYREAEFDFQQDMVGDSITGLYALASDVASVIGDSSEYLQDDGKTKGSKGYALERMDDRNDGKVLCTVNNRLYTKATGETKMPATRPVLVDSYASEFRDCFSDLLHERDEADKGNGYTNPSDISGANFETMAKRLSYVSGQPGYEGVTNIQQELVKVGIFHESLKKVSGSDSWLRSDSKFDMDYVKVNWHDDYQYQYALIGDTTKTATTDKPSRGHARQFNAEMYDLTNNRSVGKKVLYRFDCHYLVSPPRWQVDLDVYTPMVFQGEAN